MKTPQRPKIVIRDLPRDLSTREMETVVGGGLSSSPLGAKGGLDGAAGSDKLSLIIVVC